MDIVTSLAARPTAHESRIFGCWLGKSIGGTLGLPAEGRMERLNFSFYDPVPTTAPPNDDLELQLVWLHLIERSGNTLSAADFAGAWLKHIHYMWDEYGRCRWNLRRGVPLESVGTFENPFHAGMGSPIRSEIWGCLFAGDPDSAAHYAALDASLDHGVEGMAGEVLFAVLQSRIAAGASLEEAIANGLSYLPALSETAVACRFVSQSREEGRTAWDCWTELLARHGSENFTHAPLNVALTIWALLFGEEDFGTSILLAVNGGYDTDCTAATVGATLGLMKGREGIPSSWSDPIGEGVFVGPGIRGIRVPATLSELTWRTAGLMGKLEQRRWTNCFWDTPFSQVELSRLPGTVEIHPLNAEYSVPWANGELPAQIKLAGGGTWIWETEESSVRDLVCLARGGARLFLDDKLVVDCPGGLPYVPAPHRCPEGSRASVPVSPGRHRLRVELDSGDPRQDATVLLTYPNHHLCPWTKELPDAALLSGPGALSQSMGMEV